MNISRNVIKTEGKISSTWSGEPKEPINAAHNVIQNKSALFWVKLYEDIRIAKEV